MCGDITPVQKPSKVWTDIAFPTNAVTPMTHLFLRTAVTRCETSLISNPPLNEAEILSPFSSTVIHVTRTGKSVTLINPSLLEPDTTFRLFHEILFLLTKPELDALFRNPKTKLLKGEFVFVVDNGPAEYPSSPLVQMLLVRLLKLLNLDKVVQVSYAEYHSKRNFVERVHAVEDQLLGRHGTFSSNLVHKDMNISPGSVQHTENMEKMSEAVVNCLQQGRFDGEQLKAYRGIKNSMFLFNDEQQLKTFLSYTEDMKENCALEYSLKNSSPILDDLEVIWHVNKNFKGSYLEDYRTLNNSLPGVNVRTAWTDKYITAVYRVDEQWNEKELKRAEFQPIPDYIRWIETAGELHYLSLERLRLLDGSWSETPGLFRPQRLLELLFAINPHPLEDMYHHFAIIPEETVRKYFAEKQESMREERQQDVLREKWRHHPLYTKKLENLRSLCKEEGLPTKGLKHHLVELLAKKYNEEAPDEYDSHYDGDLGSIPTTVSELLHIL